MHILFLSHYFPPETNAPATRTFEHARRWVKQADIRVTVITNYPNHPYGKLYPGYKNKGIGKERLEGIDVYRVKTFLAPNAGFGKRSLNYLFFMVAAIIASFKVKKPDQVVATSPQFFCALAGFVISRLKGVPFVFELRDLWPESIVCVGAMQPGLAIRLLEKLELFLYQQAALIISVTDAFRHNLIRRGIPGDKIRVIKNGVDIAFFTPGPPVRALKQKLGMNGEFVAAYIGTIGMAHAVDNILEAAERLKDNPHILFLIVGEGAQKRRIQALADQKGLTNVKVLAGVSKETISQYYALSDLNLVTLRDTPLFQTVIPSKIFEIMAMERPILCTVDGECRGIIQESGAGLFVPPENADSMAEAIVKLRQNPRRLAEMGKSGREYVKAHFNREQLAHEYCNHLREMGNAIAD